jgi:hypothetical protein
MARLATSLVLLVAGCARGPSADLQYVKQARSLAAEWALVNQQADSGKLTATYVASMHVWLREGLRTDAAALAEPDSAYGKEIRALLAEPQDAPAAKLRAHAEALTTIEDELESA